jgi:acyl carrier protein
MNLDEIKKKLTQVFRDVFDDNSIELVRETTAADIEDWDSLSHITIIVAIEREFQIKLNLADIKPLRNVGEMLDLIQRKIS